MDGEKTGCFGYEIKTDCDRVKKCIHALTFNFTWANFYKMEKGLKKQNKIKINKTSKKTNKPWVHCAFYYVQYHIISLENLVKSLFAREIDEFQIEWLITFRNSFFFLKPWTLSFSG